MLAVYFRDEADVATLIDGLLEAAEGAERRGENMRGKRFVVLANQIGDALDQMPYSSGYRANVQLIRAERRRAHG